MRDEGRQLLDSGNETLRIGQEAGVAVQISHHKAGGRENWGKVKDSLALVEQARARDFDVSSDAYPYTAGSTTLSALARGGMLDLVSSSEVLIASTSINHDYEGRTIEELCPTGKSQRNRWDFERREGVVAIILRWTKPMRRVARIPPPY
jgi:hypothetical protein